MFASCMEVSRHEIASRYRAHNWGRHVIEGFCTSQPRDRKQAVTSHYLTCIRLDHSEMAIPRIVSLFTRATGRALQTRQHQHDPITVRTTKGNISSHVVILEPLSHLVPTRGRSPGGWNMRKAEVLPRDYHREKASFVIRGMRLYPQMG